MNGEIRIPLIETERALIACLLADSRTIIPVSGVLQPQDIAEPTFSRIYQVCLDLAREQKVPNPYTIVAAAPDMQLDVLQELQKQTNPQLVNEVLALADIIRQEAAQRRVALVTTSLSLEAARRPANLDAFVYDALKRLGAAVEGRADRASDLLTIGRDVDTLLAEEGGLVGVPTGLGWFTDRIGGFRPGDIVAMIAPYKMGKSRLTRNMILAAARAKHPVGVYLLEGNRTDFYLDTWAMLATEHLRRTLDDEQFASEAVLDGRHLRDSLRTPAQHRALQEARQDLDALAPYLRICDGRDGITDLAKLEARLRRDLFLFHNEAVFIDHLQLVNAGRHTIFENVSATVAVLQRFAATEGVVTVIVSQQNEAGIGVSDSYSPNVKGGGDLAAASDYIFTLKYEGEKTPDLLTVKLKLSRRAQPGERDYVINPASGLVLGEALAQRG